MRLSLTAFFLGVCFSGMAAGTHPPSGARSLGLGGATAVLYDHWGGLHNPAGISGTRGFAVGGFASRPYNTNLLNTSAASMAYELRNIGAIGASAQFISLGSAYQQRRFVGTVSRMFGDKFSAGMSFGFYSFQFQGYGSKSFATFSAGFIFHPTEKISVGAYVLNPVSQVISEFQDERLPMVFNSGFGYHFNDSLMLTSSMEMSLDGDYRLRNGLEYMASQKLTLRVGFATKPVETSFGIGLRAKNFQLNFSLTYHSVLGTTPNMSFDYAQIK